MLRNVEDVKFMLELAAEVDKSQPRVKAQDAKAIWPEILLTDTEKKAIKLMTRDGKTDVFYSDEQIKVWETVTTEWIKAFQDSERLRQQWIVIWLKAYGCPSKIIEKKLGISRTKVWYLYDKGMVRLLNFLNIKVDSAELGKNEYRPELIKPYPAGKITGTVKVNILKEWIEELESKNIK